MSIDSITKDLMVTFERALADAMERAFAAGEQEAVRKMVQAVGAALPSVAQGHSRQEQVVNVTSKSFTVSDPDELADDNVDRLFSKRRAPKGLTDVVLKHVLLTNIGLTMEEVQRRAVEYDSRVSPKTVYNSLYRSPEYLQDSRGHWRLRALNEQLVLTNAPVERDDAREALTAH